MKLLYRYEIEYRNEDGNTRIRLNTYNIIRETEHCYWIYPTYYQGKLKRVRKTAYNTFAYDSKEKAKEHFIRRTKTRIKWFKFWIEECEKALELINYERL